ncbi:MAG: acyltransferase [Acidimicrobiales bacterium]
MTVKTDEQGDQADNPGSDPIAAAFAAAIVEDGPVDGATVDAVRKLDHMPALDGMRGLFVILGPLTYHFAPYFLPGGMFSLDIFFVLSSFLIVSLALNEWDRTGGFSVGGYASRRVRRLMPALTVCFVLVAFATAFLIDASKISKWTGGTVAAMGWVANWKKIFSQNNYFDGGQYSNPQPFRHVWSFAVEEQFYLFAPFFLILCMRWIGQKWLAILSIGGAIASAIWMSVLFDPNNPASITRVYYGTDTRAFALLLGIALASICHRWGQPKSSWGHWVTQFMGVISTAAFIILMFTQSEKTAWMFEYGGFFLVSMMAVFMTRAVSAQTGWLHWFYKNRFLMWAGRLGFGLYLYHWLVYIVVDSDKSPDKPGLNSFRDLFLAFGLTFLIAWLSYKYIEKPFMKGRWPGWKFAAGMGGALVLTLTLLLYANTVRSPKASAANNPLALQQEGATPIALGEGKECIAPAGSDPTRVLVVGDSVMYQLGLALSDWCADNPGEIMVFNEAHLGCGTTRGGEKLYEEGPGSMGEVCGTWANPVDPRLVPDPSVVSWVSAIDLYRPDVVLGYASPWDSIDRKVPGLGDQWLRPGDPTYDTFLSSEYGEALATLSADNTTVAWLVSPRLNRTSPFNSPDRIDRVNEIVLPMVEGLPRSVILDYQAYLGPTGGEQDKATRADGVHIREDQLQTVANWLAPQLIAAKGTPKK